MNSYSPIQAREFVYGFVKCPEISYQLQKNSAGFCFQKEIGKPEVLCGAPVPMDAVKRQLGIHFWDLDSDISYAQANQTIYFPYLRHLVFSPNKMPPFPLLVAKLGKAIFGHLSEPLASQFERIILDANQSKVSLGQYEERIFTHDFKAAQAFKNIIGSCSKTWGYDASRRLDYFEFRPSVADALVMGSLSGKLDDVRQEWFSRFKSKYCQLHPEDDYSCHRFAIGAILPNPTPSDIVPEAAKWIRSVHHHETQYSPELEQEISQLWDNRRTTLRLIPEVEKCLRNNCTETTIM